MNNALSMDDPFWDQQEAETDTDAPSTNKVVHCPYCKEEAEALFNGKGQQVAPYVCYSCDAVEIGRYDEDRYMSAQEKETGWWEPGREMPVRRTDGKTHSFFHLDDNLAEQITDTARKNIDKMMTASLTGDHSDSIFQKYIEKGGLSRGEVKLITSGTNGIEPTRDLCKWMNNRVYETFDLKKEYFTQQVRSHTRNGRNRVGSYLRHFLSDNFNVVVNDDEAAFLTAFIELYLSEVHHGTRGNIKMHEICNRMERVIGGNEFASLISKMRKYI
jgi:hypothetical protein